MIRRRQFLMVCILLICLSLFSACGGIKDLFQQRRDPGSMVEEQKKEKDDSGELAESAIKGQKPEGASQEIPETYLREDSQTEGRIKKEGDTSSHNIGDGNTIQGIQGESMEALGKNELLFYFKEINDDIKARIVGKSYGDHCDIPFEELRYVSVLYWGFDGEAHTGELIVNKAIAEDILEIFQELYDQKYPIERMELIDEYDADDNLSMEVNNTSAFNYRVIDNGSGRLSMHSYGLAIDINPLYNPYVRVVNDKTVISPKSGEVYEDRTVDCPYYIDSEDPCYEAFTKRGFTWGGDWKNSKDYQHFQKNLP